MRTATLLVALALIAAAHAFTGVPFECDGTLWWVFATGSFSPRYRASLTHWNRLSRVSRLDFVDFDTTTNTYSFTQHGVPSTAGTLNSLGFNPVDNFLYGNTPRGSPNAGSIFKADEDYNLLGTTDAFCLSIFFFDLTMAEIGSPSNWPFQHADGGLDDHSGFFSGDFDPSGGYYIASGPRGVLFRIDVTVTPPLITDQWNLNYGGADFAIDPLTGTTLYTIVRVGTAPDCYAPFRFDLTQCTGSSTYIDFVTGGATCGPASEYQDTTCDTDLSKSSGASFFDSFGNYYALHNDVASAVTGFISQWDITTTPFTLREKFQGTPFGGGDGASCPAPFTFVKDVSPRAPLAGSTVTYSFTISSPFFFPTPDLAFTDSLSGGIEWVPGSITVSPASTTFTSSLTATDISVSDFVLPGSSSITFTADALVPNSFSGSFSNQATLTGVPLFSGGPNLLSNDPTTVDPEDPTVIQVQYDFSDAPSSYGSVGHTVGIDGPMIGTTVDTETTRFATAFADGDDNNGTDDETGVNFTLLQAGPAGYSVDIVTTHSSSAYFELYLDTLGAADFLQTGELLVGMPLASGGSHTFTGTLPTNTKTGFSFARARICDIGTGSGPTGDRVSGEVEDHEVFIACDPAAPCTCTLPFYEVTAPVSGELPLYISIPVSWRLVGTAPASYPGDTTVDVQLLDRNTLAVVQDYGTFPIGTFDIVTELGPHRVQLGDYILGVRGSSTGCFLGDGPVEITLVTGNENYAQMTPS